MRNCALRFLSFSIFFFLSCFLVLICLILHLLIQRVTPSNNLEQFWLSWLKTMDMYLINHPLNDDQNFKVTQNIPDVIGDNWPLLKLPPSIRFDHLFSLKWRRRGEGCVLIVVFFCPNSVLKTFGTQRSAKNDIDKCKLFSSFKLIFRQSCVVDRKALESLSELVRWRFSI